MNLEQYIVCLFYNMNFDDFDCYFILRYIQNKLFQNMKYIYNQFTNKIDLFLYLNSFQQITTQIMMKLTIMILSITIMSLFCSVMVESKQIYMAEVYRHGARYSIYDYYDYNQTKQMAGQLTSVGLREHYLLGSYVQNQYIKSKNALLNVTLKPREVEFFVVKSDTGREQQSAYAKALGMFSFNDGQTIPADFEKQLLQPPFQTIFPSSLRSQQAPDNFALLNGFQPVPIRYGNQIFPQCPSINVLLSKRSQLIAKDIAQFQAQQSVFTDKMRLVFNLTYSQSNLAGIQQLADTIISDRWLNRQLPQSFTDSDFRQIYYIRSYILSNLYAGEIARTVNAPFIDSLISNLQLIASGKLGVKKYSSISIHNDTNIVPLLTYYNLTSADCLRKQFKNQTVSENCVDPIPFAGNLFFELYQNDTNPDMFYVKTRYNGVYYKLFGKNTTQIQLNEFITRSKADLMDFNSQCKVKFQQNQQSQFAQSLDLLIL